MSKVKKKIRLIKKITITILYSFCLFISSFSWACMNGSNWRVKKEKADVVYSGKVEKITCIQEEEIEVLFNVDKVWKGNVPQKYNIKISAPCKREYVNQNDPRFWNSYNVSEYIQENRRYLIIGKLSNTGYIQPNSYICGSGSIEIDDKLLDQIMTNGIPPYTSANESMGLGQPLKIYKNEVK